MINNLARLKTHDMQLRTSINFKQNIHVERKFKLHVLCDHRCTVRNENLK